MDIFEQVEDTYGIDPDELTPLLPESEVSVPELRISIPLTDLHDLQHQFYPLSNSDNYGIEVYEDVLTFLRQRNIS